MEKDFEIVTKGSGNGKACVTAPVLAKAVASDIQSSVHGKVNCQYNIFSDTLEISISNRVLNIEPFRYNYMFFFRDMKQGISSSVIARFVVKEYKEYIDLYIFKSY